MSASDPIDTARLSLALGDLRLPAIKGIWPDFAARADKEGWPAARFLAALTEHEIAERARRRIERHLDEARLPPGKFTYVAKDQAETSVLFELIGTRYERRSFTCRHGSREYVLYVPAALPEEPQGLVLMLHGCTQDPDDFAIGTKMNAEAERHGLIVVYPHQARSHNVQGCWNWFRPEDQEAGRGEPALLADLVRAGRPGDGRAQPLPRPA